MIYLYRIWIIKLMISSKASLKNQLIYLKKNNKGY